MANRVLRLLVTLIVIRNFKPLNICFLISLSQYAKVLSIYTCVFNAMSTRCNVSMIEQKSVHFSYRFRKSIVSHGVNKSPSDTKSLGSHACPCLVFAPVTDPTITAPLGGVSGPPNLAVIRVISSTLYESPL